MTLNIATEGQLEMEAIARKPSWARWFGGISNIVTMTTMTESFLCIYFIWWLVTGLQGLWSWYNFTPVFSSRNWRREEMSNLAKMAQLARDGRGNWNSCLHYAKVKAIEGLCPVSYVSCLEFPMSTTGFWGRHHTGSAQIRADPQLVLGDHVEPGGHQVIHIHLLKHL